MTISAKIIADSISPQGIRLTTMQLRYPKFIHGEFMTHRVFSRNASSSRAIPVGRLIQDVIDDPAMPVFWGKNQKGMQAREELDDFSELHGKPSSRQLAIEEWLRARDRAVERAWELHKLGAHKQIANRIIETYVHINVVVTATDYANFYALRRHPDAQPEMKALADAMWEAQQASTPANLEPGQWHLPYVTRDDMVAVNNLPTPRLMHHSALNWATRLSVSRCARVSYLTHEGKPPSIDEDLKLYDRLVGSTPLHASPCEHQATPDELDEQNRVGWLIDWKHPDQHGNLRGWIQYRKTLLNENIT